MVKTFGITLVWLIGCSSPNDPGMNQNIGNIIALGEGPDIEIPDTVTGGRSFTVLVATYGNSCATPLQLEISVSGQSAVVTPLVSDPNRQPCDDVLRKYFHAGEIVFRESGIATVTVRGSKANSTDIIEIEQQVVVL